MNVSAAMMEMPDYHELHNAYRAYRSVVVDNPGATRDDVALYHALRVLVRGKKVIDMAKAITDAGADTHGRPRLAIARADWPHVHLGLRGRQGDEAVVRWRFTRERLWRWSSSRAVRFDVPVYATWGDDVARRDLRWDQIEGRAVVPSIPPQYRPKAAALRGYQILFEAEWGPVAPVDPLLLRHVRGPFYQVMAAWDLTPLEQAVLRQRL